MAGHQYLQQGQIAALDIHVYVLCKILCMIAPALDSVTMSDRSPVALHTYKFTQQAYCELHSGPCACAERTPLCFREKGECQGSRT